jgi:hypothetical protein
MTDLVAYTDLASYLNVTFTAGEQATATLCCGAASSAIRRATDRNFEIQGSATTRYFTYRPPPQAAFGNWSIYPWPAAFPFTAMNLALPIPMLEVDDFFLTPSGTQAIGTITVTDFTTSTTYTPNRAWPFNADSKGMPYRYLCFPAGTYMPTTEGQLGVLAQWGWVTSVPATIKQAALLQAMRYFRRKDAPFGIVGDLAIGSGMRLAPGLDRDVDAMITDYKRWTAAA